eukprot:m.55112 g.55112  ORF g.55112 m.55112 type:complete len:229 (+) comp11114_c0_seq1:106-792(+)
MFIASTLRLPTARALPHFAIRSLTQSAFTTPSSSCSSSITDQVLFQSPNTAATKTTTTTTTAVPNLQQRKVVWECFPFDGEDGGELPPPSVIDGFPMQPPSGIGSELNKLIPLYEPVTTPASQNPFLPPNMPSIRRSGEGWEIVPPQESNGFAAAKTATTTQHGILHTDSNGTASTVTSVVLGTGEESAMSDLVFSSTLKKRRRKMKRHKHKKWLKKMKSYWQSIGKK